LKTRAEIAALMDQIFAECEKTREAGQKEYAHDDQNALANFERTGADLSIPREKVWWIFAKKHWDGVLAWINGHRSQREDVRGRIKDLIVYLVLLWAMVDDEGEDLDKALHLLQSELSKARYIFPENLLCSAKNVNRRQCSLLDGHIGFHIFDRPPIDG